MARREGTNGSPVEVEGQPETASLPGRVKFVGPGYFATMGTRLIAGRDLTWSDIETGGRVAVISETLARELATEPAGAIGKRIRAFGIQDPYREVIGVVQGVHEYALYEEPPRITYWPVFMENMFGQPVFGIQNVAFVIRSNRAGVATLGEEIRQAIWSVNGSLPLAIEGTMEVPYAGSLARTSFTLVARHRRCDRVGAQRGRDLRSDRLRRRAEDPGDRHSIGARRRAVGAREDVPAARARVERAGCRHRPGRGGCFGALDVVAVVRHRRAGRRGHVVGARHYARSRGARELPTRSTCGIIDPIETLKAD